MDFGDDDDDLDDETFALVDKIVEEHNAKKSLTQLQSQVSPIPGRQVTQNGHQMQPAVLFPTSQPHPAALGAQAPHQVQRPPLPPGGGAPVGRITHAAAQLRAAPAQRSPPPVGAPPAATGGNIFSDHPHPPQQPLVPGSLQAQQRLSELEGTNKLLRTNLDNVERERVALRQKIHQLEAQSGSGNPVQAASVAEMQRQLEQMKQQLLFKDQELEETKRKAAATVRTHDTGTAAGAGAAAAAAPAQPPQQQRQEESERVKRRANGTEVPVSTTTNKAAAAAAVVVQQVLVTPPPPLFSPSTLAEMASLSGAAATTTIAESPAAVIARLWASCPESMSTLLTLDTAQQLPLTVPAAATGAADIELSRLHLLIKHDFSRAAAGIIQPFTLLGSLTAYVSQLCSLITSQSQINEEERKNSSHEHAPLFAIASASLTIMRNLVLNDTACRRAALLSCGCNTYEGAEERNSVLLTRHSNRLVFDKEPVGVGGGGGNSISSTDFGGVDSQMQPLIAQLSRLHTGISGTIMTEASTRAAAVTAATGLQALCITVALLPPNTSSLLIGVADLAHALVTCAPVQTGRMAFFPLLQSGAVLALLRGIPPQQRCRSVQLVYALLEDPHVSAKFAAACGSTPPAGGGGTAGAAAAAAAGDTPKTRAAAAKEAKSTKKGSASKDKNKKTEGGAGDGAGRNWADEIMVALLHCLVLVPPTKSQLEDKDTVSREELTTTTTNEIESESETETALARCALPVMALLLERRCTSCFIPLLHLDDTVLRRSNSIGAGNGANLGSGSGAGGSGAIGNGNGNGNHIAIEKKNTSTATTRNSARIESSSSALTMSFPVSLVVLAEEAVKYRGDDEDVTLLRTALWPEGRSPAARAAQSTWQHRLRLAQESLTLLRGVILTEGSLANLALEELLLTAPLAQRMLAATGRIARITSTAPLALDPDSTSTAGYSHPEMMFPALPVASWAYAIGSSSNAASLAPMGASERRAGLPCCSAHDVSYLARGIRNRVLYKLRS